MSPLKTSRRYSSTIEFLGRRGGGGGGLRLDEGEGGRK